MGTPGPWGGVLWPHGTNTCVCRRCPSQQHWHRQRPNPASCGRLGGRAGTWVGGMWPGGHAGPVGCGWVRSRPPGTHPDRPTTPARQVRAYTAAAPTARSGRIGPRARTEGAHWGSRWVWCGVGGLWARCRAAGPRSARLVAHKGPTSGRTGPFGVVAVQLSGRDLGPRRNKTPASMSPITPPHLGFEVP